MKCFSENLTIGPTHPLFLPYWRNATRCTISMFLLQLTNNVYKNMKTNNNNKNPHSQTMLLQVSVQL